MIRVKVDNMARIGSWVRFVVGILLAGEVIRQIVIGSPISIIAVILAVLFLGLSVSYFVLRF